MSYPLRVCFDGALYHITARGDNRERIFFDDTDRQQYLLLLRRYKDRFLFRLHAYALMPNHVHLILEPASGSTVSRIMQCLMITYTKAFNRRHGRVGHVFQGRFHSRLIEKDPYLLVASRYVHLNPVRAKLALHAADYAWSSYRAYGDPAHDPLGLVDSADVLALISLDSTRQREGYCKFVEGLTENASGVSETWPNETVAGSPEFIRSIQAQCHPSDLTADISAPRPPNSVSDTGI